MAKRTSLSEEEQQWLRDEIAMQSTLDHRNICQLLTHFETPSKITLVLQLCRGGSLVDTMSEAVEDGVPLTEPTVAIAEFRTMEGGGYELKGEHAGKLGALQLMRRTTTNTVVAYVAKLPLDSGGRRKLCREASRPR